MPRLVVFDLDFTLWNTGGLWIDCTQWPFIEENGVIRDAAGRRFALYPEVMGILDDLEEGGMELALASRTSQPEWACWVLDRWGIRDRFHHEEIYPGSKVAHFRSLQKKSGFDYSEMLFFDDEDRNIIEVGKLGVQAVLVENGLTREKLDTALAVR